MDLSSLNPEQLAAVNHNDGPALVVAGAGTGKTHVITMRIARLINEGLAQPGQILALTFTEKAAAEMLDRLDGLIGWQAYQVSVMTFHAFGSQLLQRYGHHIGRSTTAQLIPESMKPALLKENLSQIALSYYGSQDDIVDFLESQIQYIHNLQNADITPEDYEAYVASLKADKTVHKLDILEVEDRFKLFKLYEKVKRASGMIDYHDQMALSLQILQQKPNIADQIRNQYRFVLVDEYQDTNATQDTLIRSIVPSDGNIFAVGDDDQAVYGFRGARLSNILDFAEHFELKQPTVLIRNYRSTQEILDSAYRLIRHNDPERLEVRLKIQKKLHGQTSGTKPVFRGYRNPADEAELLAEDLSLRISQGVAAGSIAILATTHTVLRRVAKVLRKKGVPYNLTSAINVFEHPELIQLWYLLQWIDLGASDEAIKQVLLGPYINLTTEQVREVGEMAKKQMVGIEQAISLMVDTTPEMRNLHDSLGRWRLRSKDLTASQFAWSVVDEVKESWIAEAAYSARKVRVFEDLELWLKQMQEYENISLEPSLAGYRQMFPKPPQIEAREVMGDVNGVVLLSVHAAKGLEFDTVYIINNTMEAWSETAAARNNQLPPALSHDPLALPPEHEKRRLMYVAMTRARNELILTAPMLNAGEKPRKLSPFLSEIFDTTELNLSNPVKTSDLAKKMYNLQQNFGLIKDYNPAVSLPFQDKEGWLELSVTDLDAYIRCPYEFFLERVLKIRSPIGPQIQFGNVLHHIFHDYYDAKLKKQPISVDQLLETLDRLWITQGYRSAEEAEIDFRRAKQTVQQFYAREEAAKPKVIAAEQSFRLEIIEAKLRLKGKIDVLIQLDEGLEVRDFKTGRQRDSEKLAKTAKDSIQLRSYALAVEEMMGRAPKKVVLDYIVTGTVGEAELTPLILRKSREKLGAIAEKIRQRQFEPSSSFGHECSAYRYWGTGEADDE